MNTACRLFLAGGVRAQGAGDVSSPPRRSAAGALGWPRSWAGRWKAQTHPNRPAPTGRPSACPRIDAPAEKALAPARGAREPGRDKPGDATDIPAGGGPAPYLTVQQVAARLNVVPKTVYQRIWEGKLAAVRVGRAVRVSEAALAAYLHPAGESPPAVPAPGAIPAPPPTPQASARRPAPPPLRLRRLPAS